MKALYYGDNLQVLRDSIATESVELIYLDPPFNSNATYNVGFLGKSVVIGCVTEPPLVAEGVEKVPRTRSFEPIIQNPGRC